MGPKIYNSIQKYGWENHTFEIIEECLVDELFEKESYWKIITLESQGGEWNKVLFCNLYDIGSFGPLSDHVKNKIKGQKRTKETKQKWSWSSDTLPEDPPPDDLLYEYTLVELKQEKEHLLNEIIEYRNVSIKMNKIFDEQIKRHVERSHKTCKCSSCCSYFCLKT
jgi:hypothetical protein